MDRFDNPHIVRTGTLRQPAPDAAGTVGVEIAAKRIFDVVGALRSCS
jgi:hypothetical protein